MAETLKEVGNRYKVLATLGEGGMGTVFLVEDTTNGNQVALKVLSMKGAGGQVDQNAVLQFKQEFRIMSKLKHPNNCEVYDFGILPDGNPYFTMEVVPGKGLDEMIPVSPDDFTNILRQISLALGFIHQSGFVHCDLKPENVRVKPDGTVKLMDFGLMDVAGTSGGAIKGTLAYMAPEVAKRDRIDQRSDIYSLGAVNYQLLTGETPFTGATPVEVLRAHLNKTPRPLKELKGGIPTVLEQVVLKMMAKEPIARFQSTYDVLAALGIEVDEGMGATLLASAFVGRQAELAKLQAGLAALKADKTGAQLWVTGQAGIGKSRLIGEFRFAVQLEEMPFLAGACTEQKAPYGPFVEILKAVMPLAKENCPAELAEHTPLLSKLLPEIADGRPAPALEPDQEKILIQAAFTTIILKAIAKSGGVLVLEDWHQADPLSVETLTYLTRNAAGAPLLLVGTASTKEGLTGDLIELDPLTGSETTDVIKSMLGIEALPEGLANQLHELTGGNGAFIGNLLEHLLRTSVLGKSKGKWQLPEQIAPEDLPGDVKDLLVERLSTLSAAGLKVAHLGVVYGNPFTLRLAADLLGLSDEELFDAFDELRQAKVLEFDGTVYTFANADLKEALYDRLPIEDRIRLHTLVAEYLEQQLPADGEPDINLITLVAHQFLKSKYEEKAINYALKAASRNRDIVANQAAVTLLDAGIALLDQQADQTAWELVRCDYLTNLGGLRMWKHALDEAAEFLDRALAIAEKHNDKGRQIEILAYLAQKSNMAASSDELKKGVELNEKVVALAGEVGKLKARARAFTNLGRGLFFLGQNDRAKEVFEQGAAFSKEHDIPFFYARSLCFLGFLKTMSPDTREDGFKHLAEATEIQLRIGDKYGEGYTYMLLNNVQMQSGRLREAEASTIRYGEIMSELGSRDDATIALLNHAIVCFDMGNFPKMDEMAAKCHKLAAEVNHKQALPISMALLALASLYQGRYQTAEEQIKAGETKARETSSYLFSYIIPYVIESWLYLGRLQEALGAAQEARDLVTSTGNTEIETKLWVFMGEIHARLGENPAARSYFERARDHAQKASEPHMVAKAEKGLGWMDMLENKLDSASEHLDKAMKLTKQLAMRYAEAECLYLQGHLALAKGDQGEAMGFFQEAVDLGADLAAPALEAVALHGMAKSTTDAAKAKVWLKEAKTKQAILLEQLSEENQVHFLSFMERAQLQRDEGAKPAAAVAASGPIPEVAPAMPDDAPVAERAKWVSKELANAAGAAAAEAQRVASIAQEYGILAETVGRQATHIEELEASTRRMEQLIKFSMAVSNIQDLDSILEQAVDMIVELTGAERGFLLFFENGQIRSQVSRVNVDRRSPMDWQFSKSIAEKVLNTGQVVCVFDALSDTQFNQSQSIVDLNLRTVICVPMRIKGRMIGAIYVDRQSINENFTPNDLEMVMSLAAQAAGAIENARLHQEWVEKSKRLEMLNNLSKTISGSLDMEEVLDLIVKMTLEVSRAERGFLFLVDDDRRKLIVRAARDTHRSLPLDQDHEISQSVCTKVLQTGEAENVADALNDEEFQFQQSIMALNLRMVMCVPIFAKGQVIGLLYVDSQAVVNAFGDKDLELLKSIAGHASVSIENAKLHAQTMKLADSLKKTFYSFVHALGASIDAKHPLTAGHSYRVTEYSVRLARRLGVPEDEVENIRIAGLLHDVGKIGTPDQILMKPGSFTNEEYEIMKRHVVHTKEILDTIHFPDNQSHIPAMAGAHHEKWDGKGYPNNQAGEDIPYGGRIMALADVFDAITSKRDYREAMPLSQALNIIRQGIGTHFDPAMGPEFISMIEDEGVVVYHKDIEADAQALEAST